MASSPQGSILDRLPDETLQYILDFVMARDSPFYIDNPSQKKNCSFDQHSYHRSPVPKSSTEPDDPPFSNTGRAGNLSIDKHSPQCIHKGDFILINSTNRRIRRLGKPSFFRAKTIAMSWELPARLHHNDFMKTQMMHRKDQALALPYTRDIVLVNPKEQSPNWYLELPRLLAVFPCLRRCTLLFGFESEDGDVERIAVALELGDSAQPETRELQQLMVGIGLPRGLKLEQAMGHRQTWEQHRIDMEKFILPILRMKVRMLGAKRQREEDKIRTRS
jgi:hypothetical protein